MDACPPAGYTRTGFTCGCDLIKVLVISAMYRTIISIHKFTIQMCCLEFICLESIKKHIGKRNIEWHIHQLQHIKVFAKYRKLFSIGSNVKKKPSVVGSIFVDNVQEQPFELLLSRTIVWEGCKTKLTMVANFARLRESKLPGLIRSSLKHYKNQYPY